MESNIIAPIFFGFLLLVGISGIISVLFRYRQSNENYRIRQFQCAENYNDFLEMEKDLTSLTKKKYRVEKEEQDRFIIFTDRKYHKKISEMRDLLKIDLNIEIRDLR